VEGLPTVLPFHRAVVSDPAFAPADGDAFGVHTRWIETEFDNTVEPWSGPAGEAGDVEERERIVVEVAGKRLEVSLPAGLRGAGVPRTGTATAPGRAAPKRSASRARAGARTGGGGAAASGDALTSPMQGTIVKILAEEGAAVSAGDLVVVLEAMKMEQPITAHKSGTVTGLTAQVGQTVASGAILCEIKD
jgi:acetyl-CoA/propionyl-CoA carboxylase biotin carboxyl carrier protein